MFFSEQYRWGGVGGLHLHSFHCSRAVKYKCTGCNDLRPEAEQKEKLETRKEKRVPPIKIKAKFLVAASPKFHAVDRSVKNICWEGVCSVEDEGVTSFPHLPQQEPHGIHMNRLRQHGIPCMPLLTVIPN